MNSMLPSLPMSGDSNMTSSAMPSNWPQDIGNRFSPSDFELSHHYLYNKIMGNEDLVKRIPTVDVYNYDPWELPRHSRARPNDTEFYYFCPRYLNGGRIKRTTEAGQWKSGGNDTEVKNEENGDVIAKKKHFVFYTGRRPSAKRTGWTMHEYTSTHKLYQMTFVLIKLWKKPDPSGDDGQASGLFNYDHKNQSPDEVIDFSPVTSGDGSPHMGFDFGYNATPSEEGVASSDMSPDSADQTPYPTSEVIDLSPVTSGDGSPHMGFDFGYNATPSEEGVVSSDMSPDSVDQTPDPTSDNSASYEGDNSRLVTFENLESDVMFLEMIDLEPPLPSLERFHGYNEYDYSLNHMVLDTAMHMEQEAVSDSICYSDLWS